MSTRATFRAPGLSQVGAALLAGALLACGGSNAILSCMTRANSRANLSIRGSAVR